MSSTEIVRYAGDSVHFWVDMADDERRRAAERACATRDYETLWQLAEAHLRVFGRAGETISVHTLNNYRRALRRLLDDWESIDLRKPRRDAGAVWLRDLRKHGYLVKKTGERRPYSASSIQIHLSAGRAIYSALRWAGVTSADPFLDAHGLHDRTPRWEKRAPYRDEQVRLLLAHADGPERRMVLLCGHVGLRASEMLALRWEDLDLEGRSLTVHLGKGGKDRTVPLSDTLYKELAAVPRPQRIGTVVEFPHRMAAWRALRSLCLRTGVPCLGLHALRHTAGTRLMRQTKNPQDVMALLGHTSTDMAMVYAKHADDSLRKALEDW